MFSVCCGPIDFGRVISDLPLSVTVMTIWCLFFPPVFGCAGGACGHPDSSGLLGKCRSFRVSDLSKGSDFLFDQLPKIRGPLSCLAEEGGVTEKLEVSVCPFQ